MHGGYCQRYVPHRCTYFVALKDSGVCVTDYMVAQQYLQTLGTVLNNKGDSTVYLLPSSTIHDIGELIDNTYVRTK